MLHSYLLQNNHLNKKKGTIDGIRSHERLEDDLPETWFVLFVAGPFDLFGPVPMNERNVAKYVLPKARSFKDLDSDDF